MSNVLRFSRTRPAKLRSLGSDEPVDFYDSSYRREEAPPPPPPPPAAPAAPEPVDFYDATYRREQAPVNPQPAAPTGAATVADGRSLSEISGQMYGTNPSTGQFEPVVIDLETGTLYFQTNAPGGNVIPFTRHADSNTFVDQAIPFVAQLAPAVAFSYGAYLALPAGAGAAATQAAAAEVAEAAVIDAAVAADVATYGGFDAAAIEAAGAELAPAVTSAEQFATAYAIPEQSIFQMPLAQAEAIAQVEAAAIDASVAADVATYGGFDAGAIEAAGIELTPTVTSAEQFATAYAIPEQSIFQMPLVEAEAIDAAVAADVATYGGFDAAAIEAADLAPIYADAIGYSMPAATAETTEALAEMGLIETSPGVYEAPIYADATAYSMPAATAETTEALAEMGLVETSPGVYEVATFADAPLIEPYGGFDAQAISAASESGTFADAGMFGAGGGFGTPDGAGAANAFMGGDGGVSETIGAEMGAPTGSGGIDIPLSDKLPGWLQRELSQFLAKKPEPRAGLAPQFGFDQYMPDSLAGNSPATSAVVGAILLGLMGATLSRKRRTRRRR